MSRVGPKLTIEASCVGCAHERSEKYVCQSDWGYDDYCAHPAALKDGKPRQVASHLRTPDWCPEIAAARAAFLAAEAKVAP